MAPSSPFTTEHAVPRDASLPSLFEHLWSLVTRPVAAVAFWLAVVLPIVIVSLVLLGLSTTTHQVAFGALLTLNVVSLVVGHSHRRE